MDDKKRLEELALRARYTQTAQFTRFIDPARGNDVRAAANAAGVRSAMFGGYGGAERCVAAFFESEPPQPGDYPIAALEMRWNAKFADVGHRDLLGASMALGLERDAMGDVVLGTQPGTAYLFCAPEIADYIRVSLESAGRAKLKIAPANEIATAQPQGSALRITVQAMRLDAVVAAGWKLSRSEAQRLIAAGLVKLDHAPQLRADARVGENMLISARGYGRLRVDEVQGETRKGRIAAVLFRYGGKG